MLPGVLERLAERKAGEGEANTEEWLRSSLREYFDNEASE
jgi:hypothetical protein